MLTHIYVRLNCHKNNALWHYRLRLKVRMRDIEYCLIHIFKEVCRSIYFWDLANLTGEASIFGNALCRYFCTISKGICDTSGEDWQVDEITMWLLKSACMSAVSGCDGNTCIAWPSFSIICLGFTVLFCPLSQWQRDVSRLITLNWFGQNVASFTSLCPLMERRYWAKINIVYFLNYHV